MVEKIFVVKGVAQKLWATEDAIDAAIAQTSTLIGGLVEARHELNLSATVTDAATYRIAESLKALVDARKAIVDAHAELAELKLRIGVRTKMDAFHKPIQAQPGHEEERQAV